MPKSKIGQEMQLLKEVVDLVVEAEERGFHLLLNYHSSIHFLSINILLDGGVIGRSRKTAYLHTSPHYDADEVKELLNWLRRKAGKDEV